MTEFEKPIPTNAAREKPAADIDIMPPASEVSSRPDASGIADRAGDPAWNRVQKFLFLEEMRACSGSSYRVPEDLLPADRARLFAETFASHDHVKLIALLEFDAAHWPAVVRAYREQTGRDLDRDVDSELARQTTVPEEAPAGLFIAKPWLVGPAPGLLGTAHSTRRAEHDAAAWRETALAEARVEGGAPEQRSGRDGSTCLFVTPVHPRKAAAARDGALPDIAEDVSGGAPHASRTKPAEDEGMSFLFGRRKR